MPLVVLGFAAAVGIDLSEAIEALRSGGGGFDGGETLPGVLAGVLASWDAPREDASLVENMRVKRSFTEAFSTGFADGSADPFDWTPFRTDGFGDLGGASKDLIEDACEDCWAGEALASTAVVGIVGGRGESVGLSSCQVGV